MPPDIAQLMGGPDQRTENAVIIQEVRTTGGSLNVGERPRASTVPRRAGCKRSPQEIRTAQGKLVLYHRKQKLLEAGIHKDRKASNGSGLEDSSKMKNSKHFGV